MGLRTLKESRTQDLMRTHDPTRTQDPMRTQDSARSQVPTWTQDPIRIQHPKRTQDPMKAQDGRCKDSKFFNDPGKIYKLINYNYFHNILRLFDVLTNFPFTPSETMSGYY